MDPLWTPYGPYGPPMDPLIWRTHSGLIMPDVDLDVDLDVALDVAP